MSTKQVTITVTQSIHQVDKNGKVKKSLTTYEVMKPVEALKQVATQNTWAQRRPEEAGKEKKNHNNSEDDCERNWAGFVQKSLRSHNCWKHKNESSSVFNAVLMYALHTFDQTHIW